MLLLTSTDKLQVVTGQAVTIDVLAAYVDALGTTITPGNDPTAISTATSTDVVVSPAASTYRNVTHLNIANKHASSSCGITVNFITSVGPLTIELETVTLLAGERLTYHEEHGFQVYDAAGLPKVAPGRLDAKLYVTSDYVNATTSFTDITGLTKAVEAGKHYNFTAHLFHRSDATTSGSQFGINGPAMTLISLNAIQQITASVTAAAFGASAAVTALETAAVVETTGPGAVTMLAILSGYFNPSAAGTFAVRGKSEVAVAAGLTVKKGSWLKLWEADA